jgi:YjbE family integral membrane protein
VFFSDFHKGSVDVPHVAWCEFMELMEISFVAALMQIMLVNIVLSGDNAVVIALAARGLSPQHQRKAIFLGGAGAIVLRILLTVVAVRLLEVPFLQFFGGILLVWIAVQLLIENDEGEAGHSEQSNLWDAVKTILVADAVMSLDNTLAIAAVAKGNWTLLLAGLALSIPLIVAGSAIIMKIMDRFPVIVYVGAGLIAWTAGEMIDSDQAIQPYLPAVLPGTIYLPILLTLLVVGYGWRHNLVAGRTAHDVLEADVHVAQQMEKELTDHPAK